MSTKKAAPSADESTVDASRADSELAQLREENTVLRSQNDAILDGLVDMQAEIAALKAAQTGVSATTVAKNDKQAQLDAELAAAVEEFKDYPLIEVFERRALVGVDANLDIRLKDEPTIVEDPTGKTRRWKLRWFNLSKEGRAQHATAEGYMKVKWDELADQEAIPAGVSGRQDEYVRKGDRGLEVLYKLPLKLYDLKRRRDAARQAGLLSSEAQLRDRMANAVAGMVGERGGNADQAGSFVGGKGFSMTITPGETERVTL